MKRFISFILVMSVLLSCISVSAEELLGLNSTGKQATALSGAVAKTPKEYIFQYEGKNFIILDKATKEDKSYFFVMADDTYGTYKFDTGRSNNECLSYWNIEDELNMAYWLNNSFWNDGNGDYNLPEEIKNYIDEDHIWHTEPAKGITGWATETLTEAPLALLANYEWKKYISKIGQSETVSGNTINKYYFRTARSDVSPPNSPLFTGADVSLGTNSSWRANGTPLSIRPVFYLDGEFFANEKVSNIGSDVALKIIDFINGELYTQQEIDLLYQKPSATILGVTGEKMVGETIKVTYEYEGSVASAGNIVKWYKDTDIDGDFDDIAGEGEELLLTDEMAGYYLRAGVTPVSAASVNSVGDEAFSQPFGIIFGITQINEAIADIRMSETPFDTLTSYGDIFGIDEIETVVDIENAEKIFLSMDFANISEVQDAYEKAIIIQKLTDAESDSEISDILVSYEWDVEGYNEYCLTSQVITAVRDNTFDSLNDFIEALNTAIVIASFASADSSEVTELLNIYKETLGIKSLKPIEIYNLSKIIADSNFETFEDLKAIVLEEENKIISSRVDTSSENLLGLITPGRRNDQNTYPGAVEYTPEDVLFNVDGKDFVILDTVDKSGKKNYFVIANDSYGTTQYDKKPGAAAGTALGTWDIDNEYNLAYWLNTEFWDNGNSGNKLPESIKAYIDKNHIWHTEPMKWLEGYQKEILTVAPLAVPADHEWKKYINLIGHKDVGPYWSRTTRGDVATSDTVIVLGTGVVGSNNGYLANASTANIRPMFYLSEDFFKNEKVASSGITVAKMIDQMVNSDLYTKKELDKVIPEPQVSDIKIIGDAVVGEEITVSYKYDSIFEEADSVVKWYVADDAESDFTQFATGKTITVGDAQALKAIKASVTPVSKSLSNPNGYEIIMTDSLNVYDINTVNDMIKAVNDASAEEIKDVIDSYFDILFIDTELEDFEDESKERIFNSVSEMTLTSIASIRRGFYGNVALENVNLATSETIDAAMHQENLDFETKFYDRLKDKTGINNKILSQDYTDLDEFLDMAEELVTIEEFNGADRTNIVELLSDYRSLFTDYEYYNASQLKQIGVRMIAKKYGTIEDIKNSFDAGVKALKNSYQTPAGGGGGGSSSSTKTNDIHLGSVSSQTATVTKEKFSDLGSAEWAKDMILDLAEKEIITGYEDGTFRPNEALTREAFVTMITRAFALEAKGKEPAFDDVLSGAWYADAVKWAYASNIINGIGENLFGVGEKVSREDMMTILYRVLNSPKVNLKLTFDDNDKISDYSKDAVSYMVEKGYANGVGNNLFEPKAPTTRAMAAKMIALILK